jgi:hypothetical protein
MFAESKPCTFNLDLMHSTCIKLNIKAFLTGDFKMLKMVDITVFYPQWLHTKLHFDTAILISVAEPHQFGAGSGFSSDNL